MTESPANERVVIRTPDQRLRVFVSSTLQELAEERAAARQAIEQLRLAPVMFELGARPHPPRDLYRAYLEQSHIFVGIYWERYGWVAPGMDISGLEDEYRLSGERPKLIYVKHPAPNREPGLNDLLNDIRNDGDASYKPFSTAAELGELLANDLALMLTESFETTRQEPAPPTEAVEARPVHNLPLSATPLVGREDEVAALRVLLLREDTRLITLLGPGGTGKTRLALQAAAEVAPHFKDGVLFVALAPISDPGLVAPTIVQTLGLAEVAGQAAAETLKGYLAGRQMLLVIDNFEQVVEAAPLLSDLLSASPRMEVLVTSREVLNLRGEFTFPVPPLELPDLRRLPPLEPLSKLSAVALFVQRAQMVKADFQLAESNAAAVAEICVLLDGLPLAIELAAARCKLFTPQAMLARLTGTAHASTLRLLTGGAKDLPARQQALRNTIEWSYNLLDAGEQQLFRQMGVFVGGCTALAVEEVISKVSDSPIDVMDGIASLLDKSLLRSAPDSGDGEPRFDMLKTIQEYASDLLDASGDCEPAQRAHAEYYLAFAEEAASQLFDAEQALWLQRLETEHDNLRAALNWSLDHDEMQMGLRLIGALWQFWYYRGHVTEGRSWAARVLAGATGTTAERATALKAAGVLAWAQNDYKPARGYLEEALALNRELGDEYGVAATLNNLGNLATDEGNFVLARAQLEEALALLRKRGDQVSTTIALHNLGAMLAELGDYEAARALTEEALDLYRKQGNTSGIFVSLQNLGELATLRKDWTIARSLYEEGLAIGRELGDKRGMSLSLASLGRIAIIHGDYRGARPLLEESLTLLRELDEKKYIASTLEKIAELAVGEGNAVQAIQLWGAAEALREQINAPMSTFERSQLEQNVTAAQALVGDADFASTWQQGRAMPMERAIQAALPLLKVE
ncbi:MAG TPA: tetratricopeptide repeat protein [Ardenticatenaceae bacterium]